LPLEMEPVACDRKKGQEKNVNSRCPVDQYISVFSCPH